jgi:hypothetical protein
VVLTRDLGGSAIDHYLVAALLRCVCREVSALKPQRRRHRDAQRKKLMNHDINKDNADICYRSNTLVVRDSQK